jgi:hypothetical protein
MEPDRTHYPLPGRLDLEIFDSFGEEDSIVDRLLALPVVPQVGDARPNIWEAGVARRLEKRVADQMRERLDGERRPR